MYFKYKIKNKNYFINNYFILIFLVIYLLKFKKLLLLHIHILKKYNL